jgi:hypothetical protein
MLMIGTMPSRLQILTPGIAWGLDAVLVAAMLVAAFSPPTSVWAKVERWAVFTVATASTVLGLGILWTLLGAIVSHRHDVSGLTLLTSAIAVWTANLLTFSLIYWQLDRGGPAGRALGWTGRADFSFPQGNPQDGRFERNV